MITLERKKTISFFLSLVLAFISVLALTSIIDQDCAAVSCVQCTPDALVESYSSYLISSFMVGCCACGVTLTEMLLSNVIVLGMFGVLFAAFRKLLKCLFK